MIDKAVFRKVWGIRGDRLGEDFLVKSVQIAGNGRRGICIENTGDWTGLVAFDEKAFKTLSASTTAFAQSAIQ